MTPHAPIHSAFTIEREFKAPRRLVFNAWVDPAAKARWFIGPADWTEARRTLEPRVGGVDVLKGSFEGGPETLYTARYHVVRPDDLLVYVYDMHIDDDHLSTSLATVNFRTAGDGAELIYTENAVYFDGEDGGVARKKGVAAHFDHMASYIAATVIAS